MPAVIFTTGSSFQMVLSCKNLITFTCQIKIFFQRHLWSQCHFIVLLNMNFFNLFKNSINQQLDVFEGYSIVIKREDLIHPIVSGNKIRKLNYVFQDIKEKNILCVLTFGGAFSNHLAATSTTGKILNVKTIGIIRGEEWQTKISESQTLVFCKNEGMELYCVSREEYRSKEFGNIVRGIVTKNSKIRIIPEGGTEPLAIKGCEEILQKEDINFDVVCSSVGTGGTLSGLINSVAHHQKVIGFNALKNPKINLIVSNFTKQQNWFINPDYTFGGYAKVTDRLIAFMNQFYQQYEIPLDPIYTGKMLFGIFDLIKQKKWIWGKKILVIHTGGLQGVAGMNFQLQKKGKVPLEYGNSYF